jgi:hypothetical protein|tara:strand:+ start:74 stop:439 length:366 start_codon:yes stop_codon:yes gene_type:complete
MNSLQHAMESQKRQQNRYNALKTEILSKLTYKISHLSKHSELRCIYTVPGYTFGYPRYDVKDMTNFLHAKLISEGFCVVILATNKLFISWDINDINDIRGKKEKKKQDMNDLMPLLNLKSI